MFERFKGLSINQVGEAEIGLNIDYGSSMR